jgi:hypothetical protein
MQEMSGNMTQFGVTSDVTDKRMLEMNLAKQEKRLVATSDEKFISKPYRSACLPDLSQIYRKTNIMVDVILAFGESGRNGFK